MTIKLFNHDTIVAKVDKLVSDILNPKSVISIQQIIEQLNIYYQPMTSIYDNQLEYTNSIEWFMVSCCIACGNYNPNEVFWNEDTTQRFLNALACYRDKFNTAITYFAFQEQRNSQSLKKYISCFLEGYARVLIVRVDIKIKAELAHLVDVETFQGFMNQLMETIQRDREIEKKRKAGKVTTKDKGCFEDLRGYAWAIEQGVDNGGLHCHLLLIYNGDKRQKDWFLGDAVGKKWVEITGDLGCYYNCNTKKHKSAYEKQGTLGIGMIHKNNAVEVKNAINAALYLTRPDKYEQRLKAWMPSMRSFGRGTIPKE